MDGRRGRLERRRLLIVRDGVREMALAGEQVGDPHVRSCVATVELERPLESRHGGGMVATGRERHADVRVSHARRGIDPQRLPIVL